MNQCDPVPSVHMFGLVSDHAHIDVFLCVLDRNKRLRREVMAKRKMAKV